MNQSQLLKCGEEALKENNIEEANIKARILLEFVLDQSREKFIVNSLKEVSAFNEEKYKECLKQIINGKPLQYITKSQEFMGLDFYVDENVLIPQPDTEILVEEAMKIIENIDNKIFGKCVKQENEAKQIQALDLCTGSGAIAISVAKYTQDNKGQDIKVVASDISSKALEIAKKNAIKNQVQIQFIQSDMFSKLYDYSFNIIVSNPPYIESKIIPTLSKEVQQEPVIALDGGNEGLDFYKIILKESHKYLSDNGYVLFEIGYDQGKKILNLYNQLKEKRECNLEIVTKKPIKDLGGNDRVFIFKNLVI